MASLNSPCTEPTHSSHPMVSQRKGGASITLIGTILMTMNNPSRRFTPMSQFATDYPAQLIDSDAPIRELHNCVSERLNATLNYLHLPDYVENDINTVTNIARIMVQDVSDVFRVIEQRGVVHLTRNDPI